MILTQGYPGIELVPGGKSVAVSAENIADYVDKVPRLHPKPETRKFKPEA